MDLVELFLLYKQKLHEETKFLSNMSKVYENDWYRKIVELGMPVVPIIFAEMEREPGWWFHAINTITGEGPHVPSDAMGRLDRLTEIFLKWGKEKGYYTPKGELKVEDNETCSTCKHWNGSNKKDKGISAYKCMLITKNNDAPYVISTELGGVEFITPGDFGCKLWKQNTPPTNLELGIKRLTLIRESQSSAYVSLGEAHALLEALQIYESSLDCIANLDPPNPDIVAGNAISDVRKLS